MEHLDPVRLEPARYLDVGSALAPLGRALRERWPAAAGITHDLSPRLLASLRGRWPWQRPARVCANPAALPFPDGCFDLVISNLGLADSTEPAAVYVELARVQPAGGLLAFSTLGPDSLQELREAWAELDPSSALPLFLDMHDHGDLLVRAGYTGVVMDCERIQVTYADAAAALTELRALAVSNTGPQRPRGLRGRDVNDRLAACLAPPGHGVSLTLEVVYAHAWRGERAGTAAVALDSV